MGCGPFNSVSELIGVVLLVGSLLPFIPDPFPFGGDFLIPLELEQKVAFTKSAAAVELIVSAHVPNIVSSSDIELRVDSSMLSTLLRLSHSKKSCAELVTQLPFVDLSISTEEIVASFFSICGVAVQSFSQSLI